MRARIIASLACTACELEFARPLLRETTHWHSHARDRSVNSVSVTLQSARSLCPAAVATCVSHSPGTRCSALRHCCRPDAVVLVAVCVPKLRAIIAAVCVAGVERCAFAAAFDHLLLHYCAATECAPGWLCTCTFQARRRAS